MREAMDVEEVFHMNGGVDERSYAQNSHLQKNISDWAKQASSETLATVCAETRTDSIGIADIGCASGPNTLSVLKTLVATIDAVSRRLSRQAPEVRVYLNDLPTNDFNSVFEGLPNFYKGLRSEMEGGESTPAVFIGAYPGSFYGRIFPARCLHLVYSSLSLHWLSKVPSGLYNEEGKSINSGSIYIWKSSPLAVASAYLRQFEEDFSLFLNSRGEEMVAEGRMVLLFLGRAKADHVDRGSSLYWDVLFRTLKLFVTSPQQVDKLDSYNANFYAPSSEEVERVVKKEGSFRLERFDVQHQVVAPAGEGPSYGRIAAGTVRAIQEPMIRHHFGFHDHVLDAIFRVYGTMLDDEIATEELHTVNFLIVLKKI